VAVTLVDLNNLVLFGPGSEWLWSFVSDVALVATASAIYLQLRAQRATKNFDQAKAVIAEWTGRELRYACLATLIDIDGRPVDDGLPGSAYAVANWLDRLGWLVRRGHLDSEIVGGLAGDLLEWWSILGPYVEQDRVAFGIPSHLADFEYLAKALARQFKRDVGRPYELKQTIAELIAYDTELFQRQQDLERGVIPARRSAPASTGPQPVPAPDSTPPG
jgi:hypothetical protein